MAKKIQLSESRLNQIILESINEVIEEDNLEELFGWKKGQSFGDNLRNMANWAGQKRQDFRNLRNDMRSAYRTGIGQSRMGHMDANMGKRYAGDNAAEALRYGNMSGDEYGNLRRQEVIRQNNPSQQSPQQGARVSANPDVAATQGSAQSPAQSAAQQPQQPQQAQQAAQAQKPNVNTAYRAQDHIQSVHDAASALQFCKSLGLVPVGGDGVNTVKQFKNANGGKFTPEQRNAIQQYNRFAASQIRESKLDALIVEAVKSSIDEAYSTILKKRK